MLGVKRVQIAGGNISGNKKAGLRPGFLDIET